LQKPSNSDKYQNRIHYTIMTLPLGFSNMKGWQFCLFCCCLASIGIKTFILETTPTASSYNKSTKAVGSVRTLTENRPDASVKSTKAVGSVPTLTENRPDASVIITSSLIPTHPSIYMVNETLNSVREMMDGMVPHTPIFISVDGLRTMKYNPENIKKLHEYVKRLRLRFRYDPYVTILNNYEHGHISNSLGVALEMVDTEFVHVIQHDFKFIKHINHTALIHVMKENPSQVQIVRFGKRSHNPSRIGPNCENVKDFESKTHDVYLNLVKWSDNNHVATKAYYEKILEKIGTTPRPIEAPLMHAGGNPNASDCTSFNQYLYKPRDGPFISHLDGRLTTELNISTIQQR